MKYFLAIDKGDLYSNQERFKKIDLAQFHKQLGEDENLKALSLFTATFAMENDLKAFLRSKQLLDLRYASYDLVIIYFKDYYHSLPVAYQADQEFLNLVNIENAIYEYAMRPSFLNHIINRYSNYKFLQQEIYSFKSYLSNAFADYKLYDVIRSFVSKICYCMKDSKRQINYFELYRLGMFLSSLINNKVLQSSNVTMKHASSVQSINDDPGSYHFEELQDRFQNTQEDQIRLF